MRRRAVPPTHGRDHRPIGPAPGLSDTAMQWPRSVDRRTHEMAHPSRGGAAKPRDSPSQPGCRMKVYDNVLGWRALGPRRRSPVRASAAAPRTGLRDKLSTAVMILVLASLIVPFVGVAASSRLVEGQPSRGSTNTSVQVVQESDNRAISYRGSWSDGLVPEHILAARQTSLPPARTRQHSSSGCRRVVDRADGPYRRHGGHLRGREPRGQR